MSIKESSFSLLSGDDIIQPSAPSVRAPSVQMKLPTYDSISKPVGMAPSHGIMYPLAEPDANGEYTFGQLLLVAICAILLAIFIYFCIRWIFKFVNHSDTTTSGGDELVKKNKRLGASTTITDTSVTTTTA